MAKFSKWNKGCLVSAGVALLLVNMCELSAVDYTWIGGTASNDPTNADNWYPAGGPPGDSDTGTISITTLSPLLPNGIESFTPETLSFGVSGVTFNVGTGGGPAPSVAFSGPSGTGVVNGTGYTTTFNLNEGNVTFSGSSSASSGSGSSSTTIYNLTNGGEIGFEGSSNGNNGASLVRVNMVDASGNIFAIVDGGPAVTIDSLSDNIGSGNSILLGNQLTLGNGSNQTIQGQIVDNVTFGSLYKKGSGTLTLTNGSNSFSDGVSIYAGTLNVTSNGALGANAGPITFVAAGSGALQAGAAFTYNSARGMTLTGPGVFDANGFASTFAGAITGSGLFTVLGSTGSVSTSTLTLTNAGNSYSGGTTIGAGAGVFPATLLLSGFGHAGNGSGVFTINAGSVFDISGSMVVGGPVIGDLTGGGLINLGTSKILNVGTSSGYSATFTGTTEASSGALFKQGTNSLALTGHNLHTGGTTLSAGTLNILNDNNLGSSGSTFTVAGGSTFQAGASVITGVRGFTLATGTGENPTIDTQGNSMTITGNILAGGTGLGVTKIGSGTLFLTGTSTFTGGFTIDNGTININSDGATGPLGAAAGDFTFASDGSGILQAGAAITLNSGRTITLNGPGVFDTNGYASTGAGPIVGGQLFTVFGSSGSAVTSTLTLTNSGNSYSGGTTLGGGAGVYPTTLLLTGSGTAGNGQGVFTVNSGSIFNISGVTTSALIGDLSGGGSINLGAKELLFGTDSGYYATFSGSTTGAGGSLYKQGSNTAVLTGNNAHTGGTTLAQGTLNITNDNNLGGSGDAFTVAGGTTLQAGASTVPGVRGFNLAAGTGANPTIDTQSNSMTISGAILANTTDLGITKIGSGALTLGGANTFTGGVTINQGTVNISSDGASSGPLGTTAGQVTFGEDGTVLQAGAGFTFASARYMTLSGDGIIDTNGYTVLQGSGAGFISGDSLLSIIGNGTSASSLALNTINGAGNDYTGGTTIGAGAGVDGATLFLTGAFATAGSVSGGLGTGIFTIYSGSTFDISGSTIGGGPIVGDLSGGGAINLGSNTLTVGTSTDSRNTTFSGGTLSSAGTFVKQGTNTLTLTGVNLHADGTDLNAGTLNISNDNNLGVAGGAFTVAGGSTLQAGASVITGVRGFTIATGNAAYPIIDTQSDYLSIYGGLLSGGTGLGVTKIGSGTLTLTGASNSTFTGLFGVTDGTVVVNGTLASPVTVDAGALFKGIGTINGLMTVNGTLQPGTSIGTQYYTSSLIIGSGGTLAIEINDLGATSIADVTGSATIGGSTLTINADAGSYTAPITYPPFLVTTTGVSGTFGTTNLPTFTGLISELIYNLDSVQFALVAPQFSNSILADLTGNNAKVAAYLNSLPFGLLGNTMVQLVGLTGSNLTHALESISQSRSATPTFTSMMAAYTLSTILSDRITTKRMLRTFETAREVALEKFGKKEFTEDELQASAGDMIHKDTMRTIVSGKTKTDKGATVVQKEKLYDLWLTGFGDVASQNAQHQTPGVDFTTGGILIGFDYNYTDVERVWLDTAMFGIAAAYTHTGFHEKGHAGHGSTNFGNLAIYGTAYFNEWSLQLAAWNGYGNIHNIRDITFPGYVQTTTSSHNAYQGDLHARVGYDFNFVKLATAGTIEPFVSFDWVCDYEQSYRESGEGVFDMRYKSRFSSMLRTEIGFNNYFSWIFSWGEFIFRDKVSYVNKAPFSVGLVNAAILGAPNFFTVDAFSNNQNLVSPSLEFAWKGNDNYYGSLYYEGEFGSGYISNELIGRIGVYF